MASIKGYPRSHRISRCCNNCTFVARINNHPRSNNISSNNHNHKDRTLSSCQTRTMVCHFRYRNRCFADSRHHKIISNNNSTSNNSNNNIGPLLMIRTTLSLEIRLGTQHLICDRCSCEDRKDNQDPRHSRDSKDSTDKLGRHNNSGRKPQLTATTTFPATFPLHWPRRQPPDHSIFIPLHHRGRSMWVMKDAPGRSMLANLPAI